MPNPRDPGSSPARPYLQFSPETGGEPIVRARLEVPPRTIATVALGILLIWLALKLSSVLLLVFIALLLTAALDPLVTRLERRGWGRSTAGSVLILTMLVVIGGTLALTVPPMITEGRQLAAQLLTYVQDAQPYFKNQPDAYAKLQDLVNRRAKDPALYLSHARAVGLTAGTVLTQVILLVTMTAYLLIADGERTLFWAFRYLPASQRPKIRRALPDISRVVSGYVVGQFLTSLLFGIFAFAVCTALGVPQAILLALLAFVADAIPIVGALLATAPAVLLALTVSPTAAGIVLALYLIYQQVENQFIVPRIYRSTLQISSFGVLLAVAVGASLLGIIGALIALPIAAAIPVIERIWREDQPAAPDPSDLGLAPAPWESDASVSSAAPADAASAAASAGPTGPTVPAAVPS
ncbi:MAG: AI-2E family transporter [Thermomicrobiales bacterium]